MKDKKRTLIITSIVILLPILVGIILWQKLPDQIATHFNTQGIPDRYDSKYFAVLGIPLFLLAVHLFCFFTSFKNQEKAGKKMTLVTLWICPVISLVIMMTMYARALNEKVDVTSISLAVIGIITICIGNYLPKTRRNASIGIRIPATLKDEETWNKTHRFAGKIWVVSGILILVLTCLSVNPMYLMILWLGAVLVLPMVYAHWIVKR